MLPPVLSLERVRRIELRSKGWKPSALPLSYTRIKLEEDVGFEPTERLHVQLLSRELRSTALAIFRNWSE
jgi:hypothetical protein